MSGGSRGVSARLDDMETKAGELERLARELGQVGVRSLAAQAEPTLGVSAPASPLTWHEVRESITEFTVFVGVSVTKLEATALALRSSVNAYRRAEELSERIIDDALTALGNLAGHAVRVGITVVAPFALVSVVTTLFIDFQLNRAGKAFGYEPRFILTRFVWRGGFSLANRAMKKLGQEGFEHPGVSRVVIEYLIPGFVSGFIGVPPGGHNLMRNAHSSEEVTELIVNAGYMTGLFSRSVTVTKVGHSEIVDPQVSDLGELYARQRETHAGRANGRVRVDRVIGADGKERVVVYVPATTQWSVGSGNGTDMQTNLETIAGKDSAMREAVRQALADAGVDSSTEVMMVGYSQGGIVAMSMLDDPEFMKKYNVTTVVTVGSPVSDFHAPDDVEVLSIEHNYDLVPQLDGEKNPDQHNWTTVTTTPDLGPHQQAQDAHSGDVYADAIDKIEDDPDVAEFMRKRGEFFSGDIVESHEYEGSRN